ERLPAAIDLMDRGTADVLVLPNGTSPVWAAANELCGDDSLGYEVVCPTPEPITTRGEARAIGHLAIERQWTSLVAVTSTYHLARAELLLSRCFPGRIQAVAAERELTRSQRWRLVRHELAAHAAHRTVLRRC
ncbi:MAG: ElyC/SanA/YdcF family protein, partial [Actinomycetota bacterium]